MEVWLFLAFFARFPLERWSVLGLLLRLLLVVEVRKERLKRDPDTLSALPPPGDSGESAAEGLDDDLLSFDFLWLRCKEKNLPLHLRVPESGLGKV